jgi:hypothetical protein
MMGIFNLQHMLYAAMIILLLPFLVLYVCYHEYVWFC